MHKLIQTFAREKGLNEMKDTVLKSKHHLNSFYVSLFEKLNRQYLTGQSMEAFLAFYKDEQSIVQSLLESLSHPILGRAVFEVLAKGELFLDNLYFLEGSTFHKIYDSAIEAAKRLKANESYNQLLVSKAFGEGFWGPEGSTTRLLCRAKESAESSALPLVSKSKLQ